MKRKKKLTQEQMINAKVYKGVLGLYALAVVAYFVKEYMAARKQ